MTEFIPLSTSWLPVRLRIEDYLLLDESGAFDAYAKTELIEGEVFAMNAQHRPHARIKTRLLLSLADTLRRANMSLTALVEASLSLPPYGVPEPDIVLTSEPEGDGLIPLPSVALVIEVSDTTLTFDMGRKLGVYAAANIPEYWVADIDARIIHQMWRPHDGDYGERRSITFGEPIASASIAGLTVTTSTL